MGQEGGDGERKKKERRKKERKKRKSYAPRSFILLVLSLPFWSAQNLGQFSYESLRNRGRLEI